MPLKKQSSWLDTLVSNSVMRKSSVLSLAVSILPGDQY